MPGRVLDFLISKRPLYQKPFRSFLMLTVDLPIISGEPGPIAPAGNFESHFQLPSKFLANAVNSGAGVGGAGGAAGAAAGAAAAGAGVPLAAGVLAATAADAGLAAGAAAAGPA